MSFKGYLWIEYLENLPKNLALKLNFSLASENKQNQSNSKNTLKNYMLKPATSYHKASGPLSYLTLFSVLVEASKYNGFTTG